MVDDMTGRTMLVREFSNIKTSKVTQRQADVGICNLLSRKWDQHDILDWYDCDLKILNEGTICELFVKNGPHAACLRRLFLHLK